ncbi:hypothetical protein Tco_1299506, partial [Tanacetum coccineum]
MTQPVQNINHSLSGRCLKEKNFLELISMTGFIDLNCNAVYDAHNKVACFMLGSMTPKLHRQFENYSPYDMLQELKSMFEKQVGVERFNLI